MCERYRPLGLCSGAILFLVEDSGGSLILGLCDVSVNVYGGLYGFVSESGLYDG